MVDLKIFAAQKKEKYMKLITRCIYDIYFRRFNVRWDTSKERRKENMARVQITRRKTSMKIVNSKQPRANLALTLNTANIQLVTLIITSIRFCFPIYSAIQPSPWKSLFFLVLHVFAFRIRFDTEFRYVVR